MLLKKKLWDYGLLDTEVTYIILSYFALNKQITCNKYATYCWKLGKGGPQQILQNQVHIYHHHYHHNIKMN